MVNKKYYTQETRFLSGPSDFFSTGEYVKNLSLQIPPLKIIKTGAKDILRRVKRASVGNLKPEGRGWQEAINNTVRRGDQLFRTVHKSDPPSTLRGVRGGGGAESTGGSQKIRSKPFVMVQIQNVT